MFASILCTANIHSVNLTEFPTLPHLLTSSSSSSSLLSSHPTFPQNNPSTSESSEHSTSTPSNLHPHYPNLNTYLPSCLVEVPPIACVWTNSLTPPLPTTPTAKPLTKAEPPLAPEERNVVKGYGGWTPFMQSMGLKPWESGDAQEGLAIARGLATTDESAKTSGASDSKAKK